MNRLYVLNGVLFLTVVGLVACASKNDKAHRESFTESDSLTEIYLTLEDSMLNTWNEITSDENEKVRSLHELLHTLMADHKHDDGKLTTLEQRLDQLDQLRFDQASMEDPHAVEEYDFASNSLINEILTLTEADPGYATNKELQELVDHIKIADQHIPIYRADYDSAATLFNDFLEKHKSKLTGIDQDLTLVKRPLFE